MDKHSEGFESYFLKDEKTHDSEDGWGHIPKEYRLGNFYKYGNIFHGDHCEFEEQNWIDIWPVGKNQNNEEMITIKHKKLKSKNTEWESLVSTDLDRQLWPEDDDPEFQVVFGQRLFKGGWDFQLTTNRKFDPSKLTAITVTWGPEKVLTGFMYDGTEIKNNDGDDRNHKWDRAWIDD